MPTIDPTSTESELLAVRCQLGEAAAFDELIARWHGPLWGFVRRLAGDDEAAREILQDVWVRDIRGIPRLRGGQVLEATTSSTPSQSGEALEVTTAFVRVPELVVENATHHFDVFGSEAVRDVLRRFLRREPVPERITLSPIVHR